MFINFYIKSAAWISLSILVALVRETTTIYCYRCRGENCLKQSRIWDFTRCDSYWDECVSIFSGSTILQRGCYSFLPEMYRKICEDAHDGDCHKCLGNRCNNKGPVKCLKCSSKDTWDCSHNPGRIKLTRCPISINIGHTHCYVRSNSSGFVERGCLSGEILQDECQRNRECSMCHPGVGEACNTELQALPLAGSHLNSWGFLIAVACVVAIFDKIDVV